MSSAPEDAILEGLPQAELRKVLSRLSEGSWDWKRVWAFMTDESRAEYRASRER